MVNTELMLKTLAHIETHQQEWSQEDYCGRHLDTAEDSCDTTFCFAGWALVLSGYRVSPSGAFHPPDDVEMIDLIDPGTTAQSLLGITFDQAWRSPGLFAPGDDSVAVTLEELRERVAELTGFDLGDRVLSVTP